MQCPVCGADHDDTTRSCPTCGADLATFAPGTVVADRYEVRAFLGRGGMGSVYRAFDRVLHEEVALKIQLAEAARSPKAERRFRSEVKLARQVSHPNVCRLHDGGQQGVSRWISMELVEGETLAARIRDGALEGDEAWALAVQAADGLGAVHRAGVVHRDLKPANLMVDRSGRLRLMDFGIARPAAAGETGTGGYAQGSPEYMSPEQARGRPADARSDVYSLGVVLFEVFTGSAPFRADTPVATLLQHLETPPPMDRVPGAVRPVVGRALAKDPKKRFLDGEAMATALRAAREGRPVPAPPGRRWGRALGVAAAVLAIAVVTLVIRARGTDPPVPPAPSSAPAPVTPPPSASPAGPPATPFPAPSAAPSTSAAAPERQRPLEVRAEPETTPSGPVTAGGVSPEPSPASPSPTPTPDPPASRVAEPPAPGASGETLEPQAMLEDGALLVVVRPWADVSVDGIPSGQTPLGRIPLAPGPHRVLLTHPDYRPYPRRVVIQPGETLRLVVDLPTDGVRRR